MKRFVVLVTLLGLISCACGRVDKEDLVAECRAAMPDYSETMIGISESWHEEMVKTAFVASLAGHSLSDEDAAKFVADHSLESLEDLHTEAGRVRPPECLDEHHHRYLDGMNIILEMLEGYEDGLLPEKDANPVSDSEQEMEILLHVLAAYEEDEDLFFSDLDQMNVDRIVLALATAEADQELAAEATAEYEHQRELSMNCSLPSQGIRYQHAISACNELISLDPDSPENYLLRSRAFERTGDLDSAIADALTAIEMGETGAKVYNNLCWFYGLTARPELALSYCQYAVEQEPVWQHFDSRGLVLGQLGDFEGSISDFQFVVDDLENKNDSYSQSVRNQRTKWLEALREGVIPFTPEVLAELRNEGID